MKSLTTTLLVSLLLNSAFAADTGFGSISGISFNDSGSQVGLDLTIDNTLDLSNTEQKKPLALDEHQSDIARLSDLNDDDLSEISDSDLDFDSDWNSSIGINDMTWDDQDLDDFKQTADNIPDFDEKELNGQNSKEFTGFKIKDDKVRNSTDNNSFNRNAVEKWEEYQIKKFEENQKAAAITIDDYDSSDDLDVSV